MFKETGGDSLLVSKAAIEGPARGVGAVVEGGAETRGVWAWSTGSTTMLGVSATDWSGACGTPGLKAS